MERQKALLATACAILLFSTTRGMMQTIPSYEQRIINSPLNIGAFKRCNNDIFESIITYLDMPSYDAFSGTCLYFNKLLADPKIKNLLFCPIIYEDLYGLLIELARKPYSKSQHKAYKSALRWLQDCCWSNNISGCQKGELYYLAKFFDHNYKKLDAYFLNLPADDKDFFVPQGMANAIFDLRSDELIKNPAIFNNPLMTRLLRLITSYEHLNKLLISDQFERTLKHEIHFNKFWTGFAYPLTLQAFAAYGNCTSTLQILLDHHQSLKPKLKVESPESPLWAACLGGHYEIVKKLIKDGQNPLLTSTFGTSPLSAAASKGHFKIVHYLLSLDSVKKRINAQNENGETALYLSCKEQQIETTQLLLHNKAQPNIVTKLGLTPLSIASYNNDIDLIALLIAFNADPNFGAQDKELPLTLAIHKDNIGATLALLSAGANPNNIQNGAPLLHQAVCRASENSAVGTSIIDLLINFNADPNIKNHKNHTPLHIAACYGNPTIISHLIDQGTNKNHLCNRGHKALYYALKNGYFKAAWNLLHHIQKKPPQSRMTKKTHDEGNNK